MLKRLSIVLTALALTGDTSPARAVELFDFDAQATVPAQVGGFLSAYGRIVNGSQVGTPLPLDFANFEYTVVITDLRLDVDGATQIYSGGTIVIYEDATTTATFADPSTFSDGTAILAGVVTTMERTLFTSSLGSLSGSLDWTGGSRLGELPPGSATDWVLLSTVSRSPVLVEPGFDEQWDGKLEPREEAVGAESPSWGAVKARFSP